MPATRSIGCWSRNFEEWDTVWKKKINGIIRGYLGFRSQEKQDWIKAVLTGKGRDQQILHARRL